MKVSPALKALLTGIPGAMWARRWQLMRRYRPLLQPYDGGYLDRRFGVLRIGGTWRDIGRAIGDIGGTNSFATASLLLAGGNGTLIRNESTKQAFAALERTMKSIPELGELLEGLAEGARLPLDQLVLLHFLTAVDQLAIRRSCSSIGWMTPNGPVIGQSLDLGLSNDTATVLVEPQGGLSFVAHMNVGTLWFATGINAKGVVVSGASVNVRRDVGTPSPCFVHPFVDLLLLSRAESLVDVLALVDGAAPFGGPGDASAHLIADRNGMLQLEIAGTEIRSRSCTSGVVNNHFCLDNMALLEARDHQALRRRQTSLARESSGRKFLEERGNRNVGQLVSFLSQSKSARHWFRSAIPPDDGWTTARHVIDVPGDSFISWHGPYPADPTPTSMRLSELSSEAVKILVAPSS